MKIEKALTYPSFKKIRESSPVEHAASKSRQGDGDSLGDARAQPRLSFDVMSHIAEQTTGKAYWALAQTNSQLRQSLLNKSRVLRQNFLSSGHPASALPLPEHPFAPNIAHGLKNRAIALNAMLDQSGHDEMVVAAPTHVLQHQIGRRGTYRLTPKHVLFVENFATPSSGYSISLLEQDHTYVHAMDLTQGGDLHWRDAIQLAYPSEFISTSANGSWALFSRGHEENKNKRYFLDVYLLPEGATEKADEVQFPQFTFEVPSYNVHFGATGETVNIYGEDHDDALSLVQLELRDLGPRLNRVVIQGIQTYGNYHEFLPAGEVFTSANTAADGMVFFDLQMRQPRRLMSEQEFLALIPPSVNADGPGTPHISVDGASLLYTFDNVATLVDIRGTAPVAATLHLENMTEVPTGYRGTVVGSGNPFEFTCFHGSFWEMGRNKSIRIAQNLYLHVRTKPHFQGEEVVLSRAFGDTSKSVFHPDVLAMASPRR